MSLNILGPGEIRQEYLYLDKNQDMKETDIKTS